jgi:hypothetical protein
MPACCSKRDTLISCIFQHFLSLATVIEKRISYLVRALLRTTNRPYAARNLLRHFVVYSPPDSTKYLCFEVFHITASFFKILYVPLPNYVASCIASVFFNCTTFAVLALYLDAMMFSVSCVLFAFILLCCQRGSLVSHAVLNPWI